MNHKLQDSSLTNDGSKTVAHNANPNSTSEISRNNEGSQQESVADSVSDDVSMRDSGLVEVARSEEASEVADGSRAIAETSSQQKISTEPLLIPVAQTPSAVPSSAGDPSQSNDSTDFNVTPGRDCPDPCQQEYGTIATAVPAGLFAPQAPRCEVARSVGYDPTGERAFPCGALAQVICEFCGPMCSTCADETFCFQGEHKLTPLPDDGPLPPSHKSKRPISEVVYVEIKCPNCLRVRLALPKKHRPKPIRKCPICKAKGPAEYLAHGFTRRSLPYHEKFTEERELPEGVEFKRRTPWDHRPNWWVEE